MFRSQLLRVRVLVHRRLLSDGHSGPDLPKGTSVAYFVFLTGAFAGGIGSLVGMGGAFVALPVLTGYFGLAQHIAHGTSMAAVLATAIGGCAAYLQREPELLQKIQQIDRQHIPAQIGNVHLVTAAAVALTSSLTVILGARLGQAASSANLKKGMAIFMLAIAPTVPLRGYLKDISDHKASAAATEVVDLEHMDCWKHQIIKPMIVGAFSGVLSGIFGVGGGALTVPALSMTTDLDHQVILGTSLTGTPPSFPHPPLCS